MLEASYYMKMIHFLNGQDLEDFHLNSMQMNFAKALKAKTTQDRYDTYLLVSPYNYYFYEAFVGTTNRDTTSTSEANINQLEFMIESGNWITKMLILPKKTDEIMLVGTIEENRIEGANVDFFYRTSTESDWIPIGVDNAITLPTQSEYIQLKVSCSYSGIVRPKLHDFALLVK